MGYAETKAELVVARGASSSVDVRVIGRVSALMLILMFMPMLMLMLMLVQVLMLV